MATCSWDHLLVGVNDEIEIDYDDTGCKQLFFSAVLSQIYMWGWVGCIHMIYSQYIQTPPFKVRFHNCCDCYSCDCASKWPVVKWQDKVEALWNRLLGTCRQSKWFNAHISTIKGKHNEMRSCPDAKSVDIAKHHAFHYYDGKLFVSATNQSSMSTEPWLCLQCTGCFGENIALQSCSDFW